MIKAIVGFAALMPLMTGPLPRDEETLIVDLCGGGQISIPLGNDAPEPPACDPQACHAGTCREKPQRGHVI